TTDETLEESCVDEELILSLTQQAPSQWMDSADEELLSVMVGLADGSQIVSPDDNDAVLSTQKSICSSGKGLSQNPAWEGNLGREDESEEEETREMTQRIW
ncbi:hypothetical protein OTU49_016669, partial [Cherax quadricarinatus]